jgi:nicotinamidase-related amidase
MGGRGENMIERKTDAILVVDLQNDFITGSLAVPGAEDILPALRKWIDRFDLIFLSRDMHPPDHSSFIEQEGPWPPHCIAGNSGSDLHVVLDGIKASVVDKGTEVDKDAYSAFEGTGPSLADRLKLFGIKRLFVCGLATDYCVKATVLDALEQFDGEVYILLDAIAAVDVKDGDGQAAIDEMVAKGAKTAINN